MFIWKLKKVLENLSRSVLELFLFASLSRVCACVCVCMYVRVCARSCGYTGVMRAQRRFLQQGTTPQLDAPHSIWLTLSLRSLFSPLILSHFRFSNTAASSVFITSQNRLRWHRDQLDFETPFEWALACCQNRQRVREEMKEKPQSGDENIKQDSREP